MKSYSFVGKKLMTPGPVPLPQKVKDSFALLECHHRSKEFGEILERCFANLKQIFQTKNHAYMLASTGTGGLEAAVVNTLTRKKPALFINAGKFGERWGKIATAFGIEFDEVKVPWGESIPLDQVEDQLKAKNYQALCFQGCETSTGALLPTQALTQLAHKYDALSVVDGITALGATQLPMDEWGVDVIVGGSQKAFQLPTGMSFIALSERAEKVERDIPSYYFDLKAEKKANLQGKTRWSTPNHFVVALDIVLEEILQKGLNQHLLEISEKALFFRGKVHLPLFPKNPSPSLTCLKVPEGVSGNAIKNKVGEDGFIIVGGQDQLNDKVLRVGHKGDISLVDLENTAQAINQAL